MCNKYDVVVVGGGISGQWPLRAPEQVAARVRRWVAAGRRLIPEPLVSVHQPGSSRSGALHTKSAAGEGFGTPLDRVRDWKPVEALAHAFNFCCRRLPGLSWLQFSKEGEIGRGSGRHLLGVAAKVSHLLQFDLSPTLMWSRQAPQRIIILESGKRL